MLRIAREIAIRAGPANANGEPRSEVLLAGSPTAALVVGAVLEAAVSGPFGFLLFLTDDTPYEEVLRVHLLDGRLARLDSAWIGGPYATGVFRDLQLLPDAVHFRFIDKAQWCVRVLDRPRLTIPFFGGAKGVHMQGGLRHRLAVSRNPS